MTWKRPSSVSTTKFFYGVKGKAKLRFESYFSNRYQRTSITVSVLNRNHFSTALNRNYFPTREEIKHGVLQGSILVPLLLLVYINDLPKAINNKSIPVLFADDISMLIISPNKNDFQLKIATAFNFMNEWLNTNLLSINSNKTQYVQVTTKNKPKFHIKITDNNKQISTISSIKFLGIYINDTINWKHHIDYILPKLSVVCYAIRIIKPYMSLETLKIVYYSNFNSIINYGLPFRGTSPHSKKIFRMQKRIVGIMMGCRKEVSCRNLFRKFKILPLMAQYILSLVMFIIKTNNQFTVNSEIRNIKTRQHTNLHQPTWNLRGYQQGIYYSGVRVYNNLRSHNKHLSDDTKNFELQFKMFLYLHSFYSLEEYFQY